MIRGVKMIGINDVSSFIPKALDINLEHNIIGISKLQAKIFSTYFKLKHIPIADNIDSETLLSNSLDKIFLNNNIDRKKIKYFIYSHTVLGIIPYGDNILTILKNKYGLLNASSFGLSMNKCASTISAFGFINNLLNENSNEDEYALLVTGDKAISAETRILPNTSITGDVSAAALISKKSKNGFLISFAQKIFGKYAHGGWGDQNNQLEFEKNFISMLLEVVNLVLIKSSLKMSDIKIILPHNVNIPIWEKIAKSLHVSFEKIYTKNIYSTSHCFTSDILINYQSVINENLLNKGEYCLAINVGFGLTIAAMIIQY